MYHPYFTFTSGEAGEPEPPTEDIWWDRARRKKQRTRAYNRLRRNMKKVMLGILLFLGVSLFSYVSAFGETASLLRSQPIDHVNLMAAIEEGTASGKWLRTDSLGNLKITLGTALSNAVDSIVVYPPQNSFTNITTDTGTQVKSGAGYLFALSINTAGASTTATIYNNTACSGSLFGIFNTGTINDWSWGNGVYFSTGICVTT